MRIGNWAVGMKPHAIKCGKGDEKTMGRGGEEERGRETETEKTVPTMAAVNQ